MLVPLLLGAALLGCGGGESGPDEAPPADVDAPPETGTRTNVDPRDADQADRAEDQDADEQRTVAQPLLRQFRAIEAGDAREACAQFSREGRESFERDFAQFVEGDVRCEDLILDLRIPAGELTHVEREGDRATVVWDETLRYEVELVDGSWKLAG